jgi:hypothetical protein
LQKGDQIDQIFVGNKKNLFEVGANYENENCNLLVFSDSDEPNRVHHLFFKRFNFLEVKGLERGDIKAEYVALSDAVKKIRFIFDFLSDMEIPVKWSIMVRTDNASVTLMAENANHGFRIRQSDRNY